MSNCHNYNKKSKLTTISITFENYFKLKKFGEAGDSMNDAITEILKRLEDPLQSESRIGTRDQIAISDVTQG